MNELHSELRTLGGPMDVRAHRSIPLIAAIPERMVGSASRQRTRLPIGPVITDQEAGVLISFASESYVA
jgi:hypothetical protein